MLNIFTLEAEHLPGAEFGDCDGQRGQRGGEASNGACLPYPPGRQHPRKKLAVRSIARPDDRRGVRPQDMRAARSRPSDARRSSSLTVAPAAAAIRSVAANYISSARPPLAFAKRIPAS